MANVMEKNSLNNFWDSGTDPAPPDAPLSVIPLHLTEKRRFIHLTLLRYNHLIYLRKSNATGRFAENRPV